MTHRRYRRATALSAGFVAGLVAGGMTFVSGATAYAQNAIPAANGAGFDTHLFRPAMDSKGLFTVNGSDILGTNDISFGLVIDYGARPAAPSRGTSTGQLIDHSFQGTFQFNYGLLQQFVVGLDVPVDLMSGRAAAGGSLRRATCGAPEARLPGHRRTWRAHAKWRITRVEHGLGLALGVQVGDGLGDPAQNAAPSRASSTGRRRSLEKRFGPKGEFRLAANVGYRGHSAERRLPSPIRERAPAVVDGNLLTYGGGLAIRVLEPLDLVGETYATYLLGAAAPTTASSSATRPWAASSSSSSATRT